MLKRQIQYFNGSFYIGIPMQIAQLMGVKKGDRLSIDYEQKKLIMTPDTAAKQSPAPADTTHKEVSA